MQYISKKQARNTGLKLPDEYSCADGCLHISMYSYAYMQQIESILVSTFYICSECVRNSDVAEKNPDIITSSYHYIFDCCRCFVHANHYININDYSCHGNHHK